MKLIRSSIVLMLGIAVLFASCSKEKIELPESNDPVFTMNGVFADENFSLAAGDDGAYMYTNTNIVNGVNFFEGKLTNGSMSVEMGIFDGQLDKPAHDPSVMIADPSGNTLFASVSNQPLVVLSKDMLSNGNTSIESVKWYKNNELIGTDYAEIDEAGYYEVCAEVTFSDSSTVTLCNDMIVGYNRSANCTIEYDMSQNNQFNVISAGGAASINYVEWFFDGNSLGVVGTNFQYQGSYPGILEAVVHFNGGAIRTKRMYIHPGNTFKVIDDFTMFEEEQSNNYNQDFKLNLIIEKDGVEYSSMLADNTGSSITITGVEYYGKNANNKDVYKLTATIDAKVRAEGVMKQIPVLFTTTFGVEIP